jgi:flagellar biosynthesis protein FlhG
MTEYTVSKQIPNLLLVASGKGGVGKTWFSITLAQAFAQMGKKVLLFDGDLGLANVDIQLGLMPKKDLNTVLTSQCTMEEAIVEYEPGNFHILAGRSGGGQLASLSPQRLAFLREELRRIAPQYDLVIVDLGAGVGGTVRGLSETGRECLVVLNDEPTALTDAYAFIKVMRKRIPSMHHQIVVNWVENEANGKQAYQTIQKSCETFLKFSPPLAGYIRKDSRVKDAIRAQACFLTRYPNASAAEDVINIARGLVANGTLKKASSG